MKVAFTAFPRRRTRDKKVVDNLQLVPDGYSKIASQFIGWTEVTPDFHKVPQGTIEVERCVKISVVPAGTSLETWLILPRQ